MRVLLIEPMRVAGRERRAREVVEVRDRTAEFMVQLGMAERVADKEGVCPRVRGRFRRTIEVRGKRYTAGEVGELFPVDFYSLATAGVIEPADESARERLRFQLEMKRKQETARR